MARLKYWNQSESKWDYADGLFGEVPIKGINYWTEEDKNEVIKEVIDSLVYIEPQEFGFTISKSCVHMTTGKIGTSSDHWRTDYIELTGYDTIEFYGMCGQDKAAIAFFDSNKQGLSSFFVEGSNPLSLSTITVKIPEGAAYAIGSAYVGSTMEGEENNYHILIYSSRTNSVIEALVEIQKNIYTFNGKKVMFFGDSITYDESMYVTNLLKATGLKKVANFALNGARLANYSDSNMDGNPVEGDSHNNTVPNQVQKLLNNISGYEVPDIIIVSAGTNGGESESEYDESQYTNSENAYIDLSLVDLTKFSGAMRWIYEKLISCYPKAKIFFATPIQSYGGGSRTFAILRTKAKCIRQNCERLSTPCIDAFEKSGIYGRYEVSGAAGKYLKDGLHPNSDGAVILAKCYHRELANALIN